MAVDGVFDAGLEGILDQSIDMVNDDLVLQCVSTDYVHDRTKATLDAITEQVGDPGDVLGTRSVDGISVMTDTPLSVIAAVPSGGDNVGGVILAKDGVDDASRIPILFWTRRSDTTPIKVIPDDGSVNHTFRGGVIFSLGG